MELPLGYLLGEDETLLLDLAVGADVAIDLGTCSGRSAAILSQRAKRVVTVDIFENVDLIKNIGSRAHYAELFKTNPHYYENVKHALSAYPNVTVVSSLTHEYARTQNDCSVDLVFFDADHCFAALQRDFAAWLPKVKLGGFLIFHDATNDNWDVREFSETVLDAGDKVELIEEAGCCKAYVRVK